jgi:hypothetical protein
MNSNGNPELICKLILALCEKLRQQNNLSISLDVERLSGIRSLLGSGIKTILSRFRVNDVRFNAFMVVLERKLKRALNFLFRTEFNAYLLSSSSNSVAWY